ncbi:MAG: alpha-L-fucosidase [Akkermansia sp.]|nr:alpha-L-fucosidase [Akkermansia sp.]
MSIFHTLRTLALAAVGFGYAHAAQPPAPYAPLPTKQQVDWLRMEWYAFVHFGLNTYTNKEWGYGNESPELFNPQQFNAQNIVDTFKDAGMTGMIYTAKHHDGWCSWPTSSTTHSIRKSPWKKGKGDVVKAFAEACKKAGIKFGTYLSPWDRNCAEYGRPGYRRVYYKQIEELLRNYGDIFEIWFDGANGGDGYYGGASGTRDIGNADNYYDFAQVVKNIRRLQPDCIIWGAAHRGDATWGGSEKGFVKYPLWNSSGQKWMSLEGDTPINHAGWFWHPGQADKVKSPEHLMNVYLSSVGRGANLILNVAPNRDGILDKADVESLLSFGAARRQLLEQDFALQAEAKASESRGPEFDGSKVTDGDIESYWCPKDGSTTGQIEIKLKKNATFDVVRVREQIRLGQRVEAFKVEAFVDGEWRTIVAPWNGNEETGLESRGGMGATIGNQVLRWLPEPVTTDRVRLSITAAKACPCISELSLLRMPAMLPRPAISRVGDMVEINQNGDYQVYYTTNGKPPGTDSKRYNGPFKFSKAGVIKAVYVSSDDGSVGPVTTLNLGYSKADWQSDAMAAHDDKADTIWSKETAPASFKVDMKKTLELAAFSYLPRQDSQTHGMTDQYKLELSADGQSWKTAAEGEFSNLRANPVELKVHFKKQKARYFRFSSRRALDGKASSVAEITMFPDEEQPRTKGKKSKKKRKK